MARLQERLETCDLLHIASHTELDDESPWQSKIFLDPRSEDGVIRAAQIAGNTLRAHLAVLSSCESARGRIVSGEGVLGLSSALLATGVPAVIATLWPVDDRATAEFMKAFYEELADAPDVATALRKAQRSIARHPRTAHPFYWAGFVLIGEGNASVDIERRRGGGMLIVLGVCLLAASLWWWWASKRRGPSGPDG
jgi:CHAT domain-containing protein